MFWSFQPSPTTVKRMALISLPPCKNVMQLLSNHSCVGGFTGRQADFRASGNIKVGGSAISCYARARVRKSRYWGEMLLSPIHCCDVTKPPYLLSGELCTSPLHSNRLYVYTVCCRRGGQYFSVLRTRHTDVAGDSSGRSYVTEQGHNVPLLRIRMLEWLLNKF